MEGLKVKQEIVERSSGWWIVGDDNPIGPFTTLKEAIKAIDKAEGR